MKLILNLKYLNVQSMGYIKSRLSEFNGRYKLTLTKLLRMVFIAISPRSIKLKSTLKSGIKITGFNRPGWGGRGVFISRDDIEPEVKLLNFFLKKGDCFIDIGANVGLYTLSAANILGSQGKVISYEPIPSIFNNLSENVSLNNFQTIVSCRNMCVDNFTGSSKLWMNFDRPVSFSLKKQTEVEKYIHTFSVCLKDIVVFEKLDKIDYIKIDAEGKELDIIQSGKNEILKFRPVVQLEGWRDEMKNVFLDYKFVHSINNRNTLVIPNEIFENLSISFDKKDWRIHE